MKIIRLLQLARAVSLVTGFAFSLVSQKGLFTALLTGPGSLTPTVQEPEMLRAAAGASAIVVQSGATQFVTGMAFFLIGFLIHALIGIREERQVRVRVAPPKKKKARWFWMEMSI